MHTTDCSGLVRQDLDETVLSATAAADAKAPHWLILMSSKVVQVAMDLVLPAHSVAVTAQPSAASRRPAVSQALSQLTGRSLHIPPRIQCVQSCTAPCMHSSPRLHVAVRGRHASCTTICQRSCSSGPITLQQFLWSLCQSANGGFSPAAQSLLDRPASPDLPAMATGLPGSFLRKQVLSCRRCY